MSLDIAPPGRRVPPVAASAIAAVIVVAIVVAAVTAVAVGAIMVLGGVMAVRMVLLANMPRRIVGPVARLGHGGNAQGARGGQ